MRALPTCRNCERCSVANAEASYIRARIPVACLARIYVRTNRHRSPLKTSCCTYQSAPEANPFRRRAMSPCPTKRPIVFFDEQQSAVLTERGQAAWSRRSAPLDSQLRLFGATFYHGLVSAFDRSQSGTPSPCLCRSLPSRSCEASFHSPSFLYVGLALALVCDRPAASVLLNCRRIRG